MAQRDGRTEKATPRKRKDARRRGNIAQSKEVSVALSLLAALLVIQAVGPMAGRVFRDQTALLLGTSGRYTELPEGLLLGSAVDMAGVLPAILGVLMVAGLVASVAQVGLVVATQAAKPKWENLHPKRGLERLKPGPALWELVRSSAKLGLLALLLMGPVRQWMDAANERRNLESSLAHAYSQMVSILWRVVVLAVVIAAADYAWNRWRTESKLKMTKQEIKREHREQEGDPYQKAARRAKAREYSRNRMLADVSTADLVLTNPTHLAVALRYDPDSPAPKVVAKGADRLAAKIRKEAYRNGVLVQENKPLARELFRRCKVGHYVPANLFEAVALVLAVAYRRRPDLLRRMTGGLAPAGAGGAT